MPRPIAPNAPAAPSASRASDAGGFAIVEVIVAATLMLIISAATLQAVSSANTRASRTQARSVAGDIAELKQSEIRSLSSDELVKRSQNDPVKDEQVMATNLGNSRSTYTVRTQLSSVHHPVQQVACRAGEGAYVTVTTSVIDDSLSERTVAQQKMKPLVTLRTYVSVNAQSASTVPRGAALVTVRDAKGRPVEGVNVALKRNGSGPDQTTDDEGCAFFPAVSPGMYSASVKTTGKVDPDGEDTAKVTINVVDGLRTSDDLLYDRQGTLTGRIWTRRKSGTGAWSWIRSKTPSVRITNGGMSDGGRVIYLDQSVNPDGENAVPATPVFPFASSYIADSGSCLTNGNLTDALWDRDIRNNYNASLRRTFGERGASFAATTPGGPAPSRILDVVQPSMDITVRRAGVAVSGARLVFTPSDEGCSTRVVRTTGSDGRLADPGLPFGGYDACADVVVGGRWFSNRVAVQNTVPLGSTRTLDLVDSGPSSNLKPCGR